MECEAFIFNDDVECLHMAIQGSHKLVMMGRINFENHALIKRWQVSKQMNATCGKFKDKKKGVIVESSLCLLLEVVHVF
jgi:hypothetical protein